MFLTSLGGAAFWITFVTGFFFADIANVLQTFWLGYWATQYEKRPSSEVDVTYYLTVYNLFMVGNIIVYSISFTVYLFGSIRASRRIHDKLVTSILGTTLRWLDMTPVGRIISRFTLDMRTVDGPVQQMLADWSTYSSARAIKC